MAITSTNRTDIGYIEESAAGDTPAGPAFQLLPTTGSSLLSNTSTQRSQAINDKRDTRALAIIDREVSGGIKFEFSHVALKPLLIALTRSDAPFVGDTWHNGSDTGKSYSIVTRYSGLNIESFIYRRGMQVDSFDLTVEAGAIVNCSMGFIGLTEEPTETGFAGQTFVAEANYKMVNAASNVAQAFLTDIPDTCVKSLSLSIKNTITPAKCVGTLGATALTAFGLVVTVSGTLFFEDMGSYRAAFEDNIESGLTIQLIDDDGNDFTVLVPRLDFTKMDAPRPGQDQFLMLDFEAEGLRSEIDNDETFSFTFA